MLSRFIELVTSGLLSLLLLEGTVWAQFEKEPQRNPDRIGNTKWTHTSEGWTARRIGDNSQSSQSEPNLQSSSSPSQSELREYIFHFGNPQLKPKGGDFIFSLDEVSEHNSSAELPYWEDQPGAPLLPVKPVRLLIPGGRHINAISFERTGFTEVAGSVHLTSAQQPVPANQSPTVVPPDPAIYGSNAPYPAHPGGNVSILSTGPHQVATAVLSPVEYHPLSGSLSYYRTIKVVVELEQSSLPLMSASLTSHFSDDLTTQAVLNLVDNPNEVESSNGILDIPAMGLAPGTYSYVIITSSALKPAFQPLINQKLSRGLTATIVTVDGDIYPNYTGTETNDYPDRIRAFIKDAYTNWGTRWVLLGGDVEVVPARGVYSSSFVDIQNNIPYDGYYASLDGTWNGNHNTLWGEPTDGTGGGEVDFGAEVYIGRAPVSNATETANFVNKTILYETTPHPSPRKVLMYGQQLDSSVCAAMYNSTVKSTAFSSGWDLTDREDCFSPWSAANVVDDLNASPNLIESLGHSGWYVDTKIGLSDVAGLTNAFPYFFYSQGCDAGSFDLNDVSMAEKHLISSHGAVGAIMNARLGFYGGWSNNTYANAFWNAVTNKGALHFGQANQISKDDNLWKVAGSIGTNRYIHFETNLFGDPETSFQLTSSPATPTPSPTPTTPPNLTATPTRTPTKTPTQSPTPRGTNTPQPTATAVGQGTQTPIATATATPTTPDVIPTALPTATATAAYTPTPAGGDTDDDSDSPGATCHTYSLSVLGKSLVADPTQGVFTLDDKTAIGSLWTPGNGRISLSLVQSSVRRHSTRFKIKKNGNRMTITTASKQQRLRITVKGARSIMYINDDKEMNGLYFFKNDSIFIVRSGVKKLWAQRAGRVVNQEPCP